MVEMCSEVEEIMVSCKLIKIKNLMKILFEHKCGKQPLLSIILLDWSVRDSCHMLKYLNHQNVSRELYEIIWIEYYDKRWRDIETGLRKCAALGTPPVVDKWIVMDMSHDIYYHKHLMYNVGIVVSRGRIICFCDSDAFVKPTFVESIIESFNKDSSIVLHLDELRNNSRRFYPFCHPSFEEMVASGISNAVDGKPRGLVNMSAPDRIHRLNYGACMCALREDVINIGGADEHIDYLGHICGPYEMTFRLINAGKKEIWHQDEWLYHTWHPGESGKGNYLGPHDGYGVSTTALNIIESDRIMPLVENPAIRILRLAKGKAEGDTPGLSQVLPQSEIARWKIKKVKRSLRKCWISDVIAKVREWGVENRQQHFLFKVISEPLCHPMMFMKTIMVGFKLFGYLLHKGRISQVRKCHECLKRLALHGVEEVVVYGANDIAKVIYILSWRMPVKVRDVYDDAGTRKLLRFKVLPVEALNGYKGRIIIGSLVDVEDRVKKLKEMGIDEERLVIL